MPTDTAESAASSGQLPQYIISVKIDYNAQTLDVQQEISYINTSKFALDNMLLAVQPNRIPDVFFLKNLSTDNTPVSGYRLVGQHLQWTLDTPLEPGEAIQISLTYRLNLPAINQGNPNDIRPQIFGATARQVNLTDWYPMLVPLDSQASWILHDPWYYGEHLVYPLANFEINLYFSDPANPPIVAASAKAEPIEDGTHYILKNARNFVFAMGRTLQLVSAEVDEIEISSYYFPGSENAAQAVLNATVKSVQTYQKLFGPYPHKTLAAVQGDFNDGMEFDGLYYLSNSFYNLFDGTQRNYLIMVAAHETCHQWWFARVANDQDQEPWLDESLATYCEKLFYEKNYPEDLSWWWSYRIDFYQPSGKIDGSVASYAGFTPYTNATYRQGAHFLEELRQQVGDTAFFNFLNDYATQMNGQISSSPDFFRILRLHTQANLSSLESKYFASPFQ